MNTVYSVGLQNQSTIFQSNAKRVPRRQIRTLKKTLSDAAENARKSRIRSLIELADKDPKIADIIKKMNNGEINMDDAAEKILNTIV